jgi:cyanate permease
MRRKEHSAVLVIHGTFQKSLTTFWTLYILACLIAIIAMGVIVVPSVIQQDWPTATIAAYDIVRFVDGHLYSVLKDPLAMSVVGPKLAFGSADTCWSYPLE